MVSYERPAKGVITLAFPEPLALPEDAHRIEWPVLWGSSGVSSSGGFTVEFAVRAAAGIPVPLLRGEAKVLRLTPGQ